MREYKFKRGYEASDERLEELLRKHFGNFEKEGKFYIVRNFGGIEEMRAKLDGKILLVETRTKLVDDKTALNTIKAYNKFLEELTGYSAKERQKMLKKEVESL
ncbi:MAG: hypothetical protein DSO01_03220 [Archaeoglobi archaeon]|jgi:hypothetical protein|nr:DUF5611 family protein [Archaeoglobus sp.]NHW88861.1 DUF5611 family protein [Archaeoglobales archaeon]TDA26821.1 MAG: hypothetical protein DSN99_05565 [Archaeoglobi archaeon]TDA27362.1 MAG: hypothetical protein DSO01_03220 [Archaeoglobi archaeon]